MRIAVLVSNDLVHDQRVKKTCEVLRDCGLDITLVGRLLPDSEPVSRDYEVIRFEGMRFKRGAFFYAELQQRLFKLLEKREDFDLIWANDLDTLLPAFRVAQKRNIPLIYDSHEYFTEAAGLTGRPFPKAVWSKIEQTIFPKLKHVITVNESIAEIYGSKYGVDVKVVRNVPVLIDPPTHQSRSELGLPEGKLAILQGAFMDKDRGVLEAVYALDHLPDVSLLLVGAGEEWDQARALASGRQTEKRIHFLPKQPFEVLRKLTASADVGLSLDKGTHLNYYYSLPNKLFDYIHSGTPLVVSPMPEVQRIVERYNLGEVIPNWQPETIASAIEKVLKMGKTAYANQLSEAASLYNWQRESEVIRSIIERVKGEVRLRKK